MAAVITRNRDAPVNGAQPLTWSPGMDPRTRRKRLGEFAQCSFSTDPFQRERVAHCKSSMSEASGSGGGFLVPVELLVGVDACLAERGLFHRLAYQQPMVSRECDVPAFDLTVAHAAGDSPLFGGMTAAWQEELKKLPATAPAFSSAKLVASNLQATVNVSNQLMADGGEALGAYLERAFAELILWKVEYACFQGSGVGMPLGIVNAPATNQVARQTTNVVSQTDLANMEAGLIPAAYPDSVWACHPTVKSTLMLQANANWTVNMVPGDEHGLCGYIGGRPLYVSEKLPTLGSTGDICLFDPCLYVLGRRWLEICSTPWEPNAWNTFSTTFRIIWRGDGMPLPKGTCLLADNATTAGAFVALQTK